MNPIEKLQVEHEDAAIFSTNALDRTEDGGTAVKTLITQPLPGQEPDIEPVLSAKAVLATVVAAMSYVVTVYTISIPAFLLTDITNALGGTENRAWIIQIISLATAILAPALGLAADLFGRKKILVGSMALGCVGAIIAGQATSMSMMLAGRVITGLGNGAQGISLAIPSEVLPRRYRPIGQAAANASVAVFNIVGLVAAAAFVQNKVGGEGQSWRYGFHLEAILWGLSGILLAAVYRPPPRTDVLANAGFNLSPAGSFGDKIRQIDLLGTLLLACFIVPFMLGLGWLYAPYPPSNAHVVANLTCGLVAFVAFIAYEWKGRRDGILHHQLFRQSRNMALALIAIFAEGTAFFAYQLFYPLATNLFWGKRLYVAALRTAMPFWCLLILAPLGALYTSRTRNAKHMSVLGFTLMVIGSAGFATVKESQSKLALGWSIIFCAGFSLPLTMVTVVVQFCAPGALMATSTGLFIAVRAAGGTAGSTIASAVFSSKMSAELPERVAQAALSAGVNPAVLPGVIGAAASFNVTALAQVSGVAPPSLPAFIESVFGAVLSAYSYSLHFGWFTVLPFVVLGILCCLCFSDMSSKFNYLIDAPIDEIRHTRQHALQSITPSNRNVEV